MLRLRSATSAIVLFGGFIPPQVTGYNGHVNLTGGASAPARCGMLAVLPRGHVQDHGRGSLPMPSPHIGLAKTSPASSSLFNWLVMVKAAGATEIVFDTAKSKDQQVQPRRHHGRFRSIIEPRAGSPRDCRARHGQRSVRSERDGKSTAALGEIRQRVRTFDTGQAGCRMQYTVTIRDNSQAKARDSNGTPGSGSAEEIGATVIDDYRFDPIHLHDRRCSIRRCEDEFRCLQRTDAFDHADALSSDDVRQYGFCAQEHDTMGVAARREFAVDAAKPKDDLAG